MRRLVYSIGIMCMSVMMVSCGTSKKAVSTASLNGEWNIVEVDGKAIQNGKEQPSPFIGFDWETKRIYGNSGCNRMMGTFSIDSLRPDVLHFGPIAGTRMACPDMTTEQRVLEALEKVSSFKVLTAGKEENSVSKVALCGNDGKQLVVIEKKVEDNSPVTIAALQGEWLIKTVDGAPVGKSENVPFIGFNIEEKQVYGNAGCNSINGMLKTDEKDPVAIDLGQLATTMMMCPDMETETAILKALNTVKTFKVLSKDEIAFYDAAGKEVMTLEKK